MLVFGQRTKNEVNLKVHRCLIFFWDGYDWKNATFHYACSAAATLSGPVPSLNFSKLNNKFSESHTLSTVYLHLSIPSHGSDCTEYINKICSFLC